MAQGPIAIGGKRKREKIRGSGGEQDRRAGRRGHREVSSGQRAVNDRRWREVREPRKVGSKNSRGYTFSRERESTSELT